MFAPLLAAVIMRRFVSREGFTGRSALFAGGGSTRWRF
jgi:hypothetical protein